MVEFSDVSEQNSLTVPLGADETFTGEWELSFHHDLMIVCKTDAAGTIYVDFSTDEGRNADSTLSFDVAAGANEFHTLVKGPRSVRVRLVNGSTAQTYCRLQTSFGTFRHANAPLGGSIGEDADAIVTRPTNSVDEVALGRRSGQTLWHKWGYNLDVDSATEEMIWEPGGLMTFLTTASTLDIVSTSTDDADGGIGAHGVVVYGIDANRESAIEVVLLNGTTTVTITGTFLGVNRVALFRAGSLLINDGKITVTATTGGTTQATVPAGEGTTQQAIFFTQAGHTMLATDLEINVLKLSGGGAPRLTVKAFVQSFVSNAKYEVFRTNIDAGVENHFVYQPHNPFPVGEKSVLYFTADTDTNNTSVNLRFSGKEVKLV